MTEPFIFANGQAAHSSKDLVKLCQDFPTDGVRYLLREDLEKWLVYIGDEQVAQYASQARIADLDDVQKLDFFLNNLQDSSPKVETNDIASPAVVQAAIEKKELKIKPVPEVEPVILTQEVAVQTEVKAQPSVSESKEVETSFVEKKPTSQAESTPRTKSNIFHWIADLFRS